jgi:hypothetical protein
MADLPSHPESSESAALPARTASARRLSPLKASGLILAVVAVVVVVALHLTGVLGAGAH